MRRVIEFEEKTVSIRTGIVTILTVLVLSLSLAPVSAQDNAPAYRLVGYYTSYSIYDQNYLITDIPAHMLTHLNYAYVNISNNLQCVSSDSWADTGYSYPGDRASERIRGNFKQLGLLRANHPELKILMTIGGWDFSDNFSEAVRTENSRTRLIRSCVAFMRDNGFDGIDIDWRYPVIGGRSAENASPEDTDNLTLFLRELRAELDRWSIDDGRTYLLTLTAPAAEAQYRYFDLQQIHGALDWINLQAFGFYGAWSEIAGHHAGLYANRRDPLADHGLTVDVAVNAYLDAGVPADKIVLGTGFYAQTWRNIRPSDYFGLFQPTGGVPSGTRDSGTLFYRDLGPFLSSQSYVRFFDDEARAAWMYNAERRIGISYENAESLLHKVAYVRERGLGGMAVWQLSYDDAQHTLLSTLYNALTLRPQSAG